MTTPEADTSTTLQTPRRAPNAFRWTLLREFDPAREQVIGGWLRIAFFSSILFNHAVTIPWEFIEGRNWVIFVQSLRDFGAVGFFLIGGVTLQRKILNTEGPVVLPINLLRLTVAAAFLTLFDITFDLAKGSDPKPLVEAFYSSLYDTNLWFFVAYAFASAMLLTLDRKGMFWTGVCCLIFVMFPAKMPLLSPYILQTISLAFICMAIGMQLHAKATHPAFAALVAACALVLRTSLDDFGEPTYHAIDVVLRVVYGIACFLLLKSLADVLCQRVARPPGWTNYLFVPYIIQTPLVIVLTVVLTAVYTQSLHVNMRPIFLTFGATIGFLMLLFVTSLAVSFVVAWLLRRFRIRV